jgi:hypothetical protein
MEVCHFDRERERGVRLVNATQAAFKSLSQLDEQTRQSVGRVGLAAEYVFDLRRQSLALNQRILFVAGLNV